MNDKEMELLLSCIETGDCCYDHAQAEYDYQGAVPEYEDPADWLMPVKIKGKKVG